MAFETIKGQKVFSNIAGMNFIFGDFFVVFPGDTEPPRIYSWNQLLSVTESKGGYSFYTNDGVTYNLEMSAFSSKEQFLLVRAIIEGQIANFPEIHYKFDKRILPLKYLYRNVMLSDNAFISKGYYSDKVINSCNISLVTTKIGRYIFLLALLLIGVFFFLLTQILGNIEDNWIYYLPISIFTGIIVTVIIYLIIGIFARQKFASVSKHDPALSQEITIVIAPEGFAAVESCAYTGADLIPWKEANFFIETHVGLVIFRDNKSVFWLPKSFMQKSQVSEVLGFIAARVKQR